MRPPAPVTWGSACITVSSSDLIPFAIFSSFRTRAILKRRVELQCRGQLSGTFLLWGLTVFGNVHATSLSNEMYGLDIYLNTLMTRIIVGFTGNTTPFKE